jgi:heme-degrading monooxygenase HmoA
MIVRMWRGEAMQEDAGRYAHHATTRVFPALARIAGQRGALLLRREAEGRVEFLVLTFWDSMDTVRAFAGDGPDRAVVDPEARAVLTSFDELVRHFDLVHGSVAPAGGPASS